MKKIALIVFLLAVGVAAAGAQESRQDFSVSGSVLIPPFRASQTNVQVSAQREFGMLASYRFMLTPTSAVEANFGMTYQGKMNYLINSNTNHYQVNNRTTEISGAYVRSFVFRNFNPFVEGGGGAFIFLPVRDAETQSLDVQQQTEIGAIWGAGVAYEISPSFDIRGEFRGLVTKVPTFNAINNEFVTNKWYNIYDPTIGVAYHF
jgi:opacity protein-like surface antigen